MTRPPVDLRITGAEQFAHVAKALRDAGDKELRKELYRGLNRATKPLKAEAQAEAAAILPRRGGLSARVAKARFTTKSRGGQNPSVRIVAKDAKGRSADLARIDQGEVRHPVYGHGPWVKQAVRPGWFTRPMQEGADVVRREVVAAIDAVARKLSAK